MKRRGTFQRAPRAPWWTYPAFLLPAMVSLGCIIMVLALRLMGYPS